MRKRLTVVWMVAAALTVVGTAVAEGPEDERRGRRVLIIDEGGPTRPAFVAFVQGFRAALAEVAQSSYEVYVENLDLFRLGRSGENSERTASWLLEKYRNASFDAVVTTGPVTRDFVIANRANFAAGAAFVDLKRPGDPPLENLPPAYTFVLAKPHVAESIRLGQRLFPASKRVAVVAQSTPHPQMVAAGLDEARQTTAELGIELVPLVDLSLADLRARLRALPADSVVIYIGYWYDDPKGIPLVPATVLETLCRDTTAPVFGVLNTYMGRGIVGGVCIDAQELGATAARLAVASQTGSMPEPQPAPPAVLLDRRALDRFKVPESRLPSGATILFDVPRFWDRYWPQAVAAICLLALQAVLIATLVNQLRRRQQAERLVDEQRTLITHAGRISTLGQFAAALAHELGQPLGAILNNLEAAEMLLREDSSQHAAELREILRDIAADDRRAGDVLDRIRAMVRRQPFRLTAVDVTELFRGTIALARARMASDRIDLSTDCPPRLPLIAGDEILLQQAILNLVSNSADAIHALSKASPAGPGSPSAAPRITLAARQEGELVELAVLDTGGGLPEEVARVAFEPFATTKADGLGVGMSIVRSIVELHDGKLELSNDAGHGLAVRMRLPVWTNKEES